MNIGQKNYRPKATLGVKQYLPMYSLGNRMHVKNQVGTNLMTADTSRGINNNSNSNTVAREPIRGVDYKPQPRSANIEKPKRESVQNSKFA